MRQTREYYKKRFEDQMKRFCYIPQDGERIVQCRDPYPPFWFISNMGYLFSVYYDEMKIIKPNHRWTGKKNRDGKRGGQDWYYEYRVNGEKWNRHVQMHLLIAEHFLISDFDDEKMEVHHIKKRMNFAENESVQCNRADNLQILPKEIHNEATRYGSKTMEQLDQEMEEKVKKSGCPVYGVLNLTDLVQMICEQNPHTVYITNITDNVDDIEVQVYKDPWLKK